ncbi:hypothetical protein HPP92_000887 [Vanilla planifolia]|uniref:Uncharacterized protein n=1 Tax=Vanilla planifolia TaxID=51239 RepID=A0A835VH27_VANPL|nr:hypothetical protein HPP92_000887 [Vanilla planifolia]
MDYNLAALKLFCGQSKNALHVSFLRLPCPPLSIYGIRIEGLVAGTLPNPTSFRRCAYMSSVARVSSYRGWTKDGFLLDDGSGVIELSLKLV